MDKNLIDYNNCTILRCFKKDTPLEYVDVPCAGGTSGATRTAILKHADALVYGGLWCNASLANHVTKYDYYIILRRVDGKIEHGNYPHKAKWAANHSVLEFDHAGGSRNSNHICYFDEDYNLKYIYNSKDAKAEEV